MKSNQLSVLQEKHCPWILQEVHCRERSQGRPEIDCVSFQKDNTIKTIKTVKLMEFILLQAKSSSEIKIILFSRFGGMQIVVRKGMQYEVKIKTFSSFTLFFLHTFFTHRKL